MEFPENNFANALARGELQIGLWSSLNSTTATEIIGHSGFDWVLLDMEHAPSELTDILAQLQVLDNCPTTSIVRAPWNDMVMIKRLLDAGARSLMLPYIQSADEARKAITYTRYPTPNAEGLRGVAGASRASNYGRISNYLQKANDAMCVLLQVETIEAIGNIKEIAAVDGVTGIFVGPSDLSASMGKLGEPNHEDVRKVIKQAAQTLAEIGMPSGILASNEEIAREYMDWGYKFVAVGSDAGLLLKNSDQLAKRFKS